jgi:hypothetical protein
LRWEIFLTPPAGAWLADQPQPIRDAINAWLIERVTEGPPPMDAMVELEPDYEYEYTIPSVGVTVGFFALTSHVARRLTILRFD